MKTSRLLLLLLCSFSSISLFAQLDFKIQLMPDGTKWGIYVDPQPGINPTANTITGSGQITMVAPLNFVIVDFNSVNGFWSNNAVINSPLENPTKSYISFGLNSDVPKIVYTSTAPTLLFTFKKASNFCPDSLYLIENGVDPFDDLPNSANSNPGNEITVLDFGTTPPTIYEYGENIAPFAWDCHDCDGDGIANAFEDTNGDGEWTPGVDVSDLCNGGGGGCVEITSAQLHCAGGGTACGNNPAGPLSLAVDIIGGQAPFTVKYTDGSTDFTLQNYQSGSPFPVASVNGTVYSLVAVTGADDCVANPEDFVGEVEVLLPGAVQFTTQPVDVTICPTQSASFEVCATATNGSFEIHWEFSSDQGATWQPLNMNSVFSQSDQSNGCKSLFVNNVNGLHGYRFRAVAEGANVLATTSQAATLNLQGPIQAISHPTNIKVCAGETVVFNAVFDNFGAGDIEYTWQLSHNNGATWWDAMPAAGTSGIYSNELTIQNIPGNANGDIYRLRARVGDCGFVYTQTALLTVEGPLQVEQQPDNVKVCNGEAAVFTAAFGNFGSGDIEYTWQLSHNNGGSWLDVTQSANIAGVNMPTLTINNVATSFGNDIFRLRAKVGTCDAVFTQPALLTVEGPVEILAVISPVTVCRGEAACFEVQASLLGSGQLSYQWQERHSVASNWTDISGATASVLCLANTEDRNGNCLRALVRTTACPAVTSVEACLIVGDKAVFAQQPENIVKCAGEAATLTASAAISDGYAGQVEYRWQTSADGGLNWQDLNNDGTYDGALDGTLTISDVSALGNQTYRLSAQTGICEATYSDAASITVEGPIAIAQQPQSLTVCHDGTASFTASASNLGAGSLLLQWQVSDNGTDWSDIAEGSNYAGTHTSTLTVQNATAEHQFRLSASTGHCAATYSAPATLTVEAPILFSQQPENATICPDESASFTIAVGGGNGALSLQWQSSTTGQVWTDIAEGGNYAGTQTNTLTIAAAAGLGGSQYRLVAASQNCTAYSAQAVLTLEDDATCNPVPGYQDCVSLSVKRLENNIGWSVWVKADSSFTETPYQLPTGGKVTLVVPIGFAFQGLTSHNGGKWKPGKVSFNPPQDPGKIYVEFNLTPNQNFLELTPGAERLLFTFSVVGGCPTSLVLMDEIVPPGFFPNQFTGFGSGLTQEAIPFHFCGNYGQSVWDCPTTWNLMAPTGGSTVAEGEQHDLNPSAVQVDFPSENETVDSYFGVSPNPANDFVNIVLGNDLADGRTTLALWDLQGKKLREAQVESITTQLDLGDLPAGVYLVSLAQNGRIVQREKLVKN